MRLCLYVREEEREGERQTSAAASVDAWGERFKCMDSGQAKSEEKMTGHRGVHGWPPVHRPSLDREALGRESAESRLNSGPVA